MTDRFHRGPILGPLVLVLAGVVVAAAPIYVGDVLSRFGWQAPSIGLLLGGLIALCGVGVFAVPTFSRELGVLAVVLSIMSLFGALGGLLVGMLLGILGGSLCVSWKPAG